jgi:hypothetical protein
MAHYRLYFIGRDDHFMKAEVIECLTDGDALALARAACAEHPAIEIWEGARRVDRVDADTTAASDAS